MVQSCGKEHLGKLFEAGGPKDADMNGMPMVIPDERLFAEEVMGGVASPITRLEGGGVGRRRVGANEVDLSAHADVMHVIDCIGRDLSEAAMSDASGASLEAGGHAINLPRSSSALTSSNHSTRQHGGPSSRWSRRHEVYVTRLLWAPEPCA
jgi:hypothetical protein